MNCYNRRMKSTIYFGLGILTATFLPTEWALIVAAAALVIVSFICLRR